MSVCHGSRHVDVSRDLTAPYRPAAFGDLKMARFGLLASFFVVFLGAAAGSWLSIATAEDWPQWQGPDRNSVSKETGLLQEWPKDGPPLAWRIPGLGGGDSAPSIADGRIF